jgi:GTP cyclohydrolase III
MRKEKCKKCGRVYELEDNEGLAICICEMGGRYEFTITIAAEGKTPEEAWEEACNAFAEDPGATPEDYKFEEVEQ